MKQTTYKYITEISAPCNYTVSCTEWCGYPLEDYRTVSPTKIHTHTNTQSGIHQSRRLPSLFSFRLYNSKIYARMITDWTGLAQKSISFWFYFFFICQQVSQLFWGFWLGFLQWVQSFRSYLNNCTRDQHQQVLQRICLGGTRHLPGRRVGVSYLSIAEAFDRDDFILKHAAHWFLINDDSVILVNMI